MEILNSTSGLLDLAIIGGGPAGTAAALEAGRCGLHVAIWERDCFPRDKVCGEFISSEALPLLQTVIPSAVARGAVIQGAEFASNAFAQAFRLPRAALGLSRHLLDAELWKACEAAGIEVHEAECIRKVRRLASGRWQQRAWEIESASGSTRTAKSLIVACGRWWALDGLPSPARAGASVRAGRWLGAKAHFAGVAPRGNVEMYFFRGGYCGLAPVEDGAYNVCCLVHRERVRECGGAEWLKDFAAWLGQLSCHPALEARLRGAVQVTPVVTTAPVHVARGRPVQQGALMIGDASGFLDPFTGEGISMALHSGRLAARAIVTSLSEGFSGEQAAEVYRENLARAVRRTYKIAGVARSLIHGPAWVQSLATAPLRLIGKRLVSATRWREGREERSSGSNWN
ncbi:MAG: FAD-dependent oxidoreductase [Acidobacteriota bacterium]